MLLLIVARGQREKPRQQVSLQSAELLGPRRCFRRKGMLLLLWPEVSERNLGSRSAYSLPKLGPEVLI